MIFSKKIIKLGYYIFFLVLFVSDSDYSNFTGTQPIPCHGGIYFISLPGARAAAVAAAALFFAAAAARPHPTE
jgi:hypothetical protein